MSTCEAYCTSQESCVAYNYDANEMRIQCDLIGPVSSCPSGFQLLRERNTATSTNDLIVRNRFPGVYCYGKVVGKVHEA